MKKKFHTLYRSLLFLASFIIWTSAIKHIDVQPIGPKNSEVGFASLNAAFHRLSGVHMNLYILTDWLSLIPVSIMMGFAAAGLIQWIRRKHIIKVDTDILALGAFYIAVFAAYLLFEEFPVNYRPVLIDGFLEASYPSSTTLLVLTVMSALIIQIRYRMRSSAIKRILIIAASVFTAGMVLGRLICGVHWLTDIIGGILLSAALVEMYAFTAAALLERNKAER